MIIEREFSENDFLNDKSFLLKLDNERNRRVFVKITVLDKNEMPIRDIEGQITTGGSINIETSSEEESFLTLKYGDKSISRKK